MKNVSFEEAFPSIIELARFAPSVHNTQPWRITSTNSSVEINLDEAHTLRDGDPTGRETTISLGIIAEAIVIVAEQFGFREVTTNLKDKTLLIRFESTNTKSSTKKYADLLKARCTDRSLYSPVTISDEDVHRIKDSATNFKVKIHVIRDPQIVAKVADYTSKGISLALSNPSFRKELSQYLIVPWSHKKRGISVRSLYINPLLAVYEPLLMRLGIGLPLEVKLEKKRWLSASGIVVITADGDLSQYWLATGRAYMRVSLEIEELGLSQATSAAIVEASNYHDDVEELLGTNQRILSIIRIGKGETNRRHSPRVDYQDLITSSSQSV